jgi:hypothetical protein
MNFATNPDANPVTPPNPTITHRAPRSSVRRRKQ